MWASPQYRAGRNSPKVTVVFSMAHTLREASLAVYARPFAENGFPLATVTAVGLVVGVSPVATPPEPDPPQAPAGVAHHYHHHHRP